MNMYSNRYRGFTLIEMMVVSALLVTSVVFFSQMFMAHTEEKLVDFHVSEFMTLSNSTRAYVHNIDGIWPGEEEVEDGTTSCTTGFNVLETGGYFDEIEDDYVFSCLQLRGRTPVLIIEYDFKSGAIATDKEKERAKWVASLLPSASISGSNVKLYIPKPRVAQLIESDSVKDIVKKEIVKPACRRPRLSTMIKSVCVKLDPEEAEGVFNPKHLGGYRVNVTDTEKDGVEYWNAEIEVSYAGTPDEFSSENACDDLEFDYIVYCE